jgi:hypothetical protein
MPRCIAELNFDMVGENVKSTNAVFAASYLPDANPSFLNALTESLVDFINRYNDDVYPSRPDMQVVSLTAAVLSCSVFAKNAETRRRIEQVAAVIEQDQPAAQKRVENVAVSRAAELGVARTVPAPTEADKHAAHLVPVWEKGKQLTSIGGVMPKVMADPSIQVQKIRAALMSATIQMRARGESELRLMGLSNAPATWVDGTRSILDIANAIAVEYAPIGAEALEAYFRAFEKAGAMKIAEK